MAMPNPRISCLTAFPSTTMAPASACAEAFQAGASVLECRWLPKVLHMRTEDAPCAQAVARPERVNAAAAVDAVLRKIRRECLAIQTPCGKRKKLPQA